MSVPLLTVCFYSHLYFFNSNLVLIVSSSIFPLSVLTLCTPKFKKRYKLNDTWPLVSFISTLNLFLQYLIRHNSSRELALGWYFPLHHGTCTLSCKSIISSLVIWRTEMYKVLIFLWILMYPSPALWIWLYLQLLFFV